MKKQKHLSMIANKKIVFLALLLSFTLPSLFNIPYVSADLQFDGTKVYIDTPKAYISADPHTLGGSGWVTFELNSKTYDGDIDLYLGFDSSKGKITKAEIYKNTLVYDEIEFHCPDPYEYNYTQNLVTCYANHENGTFEYLFKDIPYDYFVIEDDTFYQMYSYRIPWVDLNKQVQKKNFDYNGKDKWFHLNDVNINEDQLYRFRVWFDIDLCYQEECNFKYDFVVKPSSLSFSEAINQDKLFLLDPWANSSYQLRTCFNLTNPTGSDLQNISVKFDLEMDSFDDATGTGSDFEWGNLTDFYGYWNFTIVNMTASANTTWIVNVDEIKADNTSVACLYYNNSLDIVFASDIEKAGIHGDNFDDCDLSDWTNDVGKMGCSDSVNCVNGYTYEASTGVDTSCIYKDINDYNATGILFYARYYTGTFRGVHIQPFDDTRQGLYLVPYRPDLTDTVYLTCTSVDCGSVTTFADDETNTLASNTWHNIEVGRQNDGFGYGDLGGTILDFETIDDSDLNHTTFNRTELQFRNGGGHTSARIDHFLVTRWCDTCQSIRQAEESNISAPAPPTPTPNVTIGNLSFVLDVSRDLPIKTISCQNDNLVIFRERTVQSGEIFVIPNQTDVRECINGCSNSTWTNWGNAGCQENNYLFILIAIVVVILFVGFFRWYFG